MLTDPAILERVIDPKRGDFPADLARLVLKFTFPPKDRARYEKLSYKAQDRKLSDAERAELEDYLNVNDLLIILKAKAEASLRHAADQLLLRSPAFRASIRAARH